MKKMRTMKMIDTIKCKHQKHPTTDAEAAELYLHGTTDGSNGGNYILIEYGKDGKQLDPCMCDRHKEMSQ